MIYLIASSAFKDNNDFSVGFEILLKIGYTGEESKKSRFDTYITENPTCKILYLIEEGLKRMREIYIVILNTLKLIMDKSGLSMIMK